MRGNENLFRNRSQHDHSPVTYIELFFDLVFVFAITQLAHRLLEHLTPIGALETILLLFATWWVWIYTSWATNWLDPDRGQVRIMLIAMMVGGLALSSAIPYAFGKAGWLFVGAYCTMQLGRAGYMVWASWGVHKKRTQNQARIGFWFVLSLPLWIAGAMAEHQWRIGLWTAALIMEYAGPYVLFPTPWLGRSSGADWDIAGGHMAERCALFIIIALGETVLVTGATFAKLPQDWLHWVAFITCFLNSATLWWIYFDLGARRGSAMMEVTTQVGLLARNAYTYWHIPIVAGIIVTAVGDELVLAHPHESASAKLLLTTVGGPWLFLLGNMGFKWATSEGRFPPLSHLLGSLMLAAVAVGAWVYGWSALHVGQAMLAVLILTAVWEWGSFHGGWQRWMPWLGRRLKWPTELSD